MSLKYFFFWVMYHFGNTQLVCNQHSNINQRCLQNLVNSEIYLIVIKISLCVLHQYFLLRMLSLPSRRICRVSVGRSALSGRGPRRLLHHLSEKSSPPCFSSLSLCITSLAETHAGTSSDAKINTVCKFKMVQSLGSGQYCITLFAYYTTYLCDKIMNKIILWEIMSINYRLQICL